MRHQVQPLTMMMLIIVLCQGLFVALEASAQIHLPTDDDHHHELLTVHACIGEHCPANSRLDDSSDRPSQSSNPSSASNPSSDSCDHCCACHGHGSHTSLLGSDFSLVIAPFNMRPVAEIPQFYSFRPASLYRPPIA